MSESVVADFTGKFVVDGNRGEEPIRGRIVLSQKRLVLAGPNERATIPLTNVFDIGVGEVPQAVSAFFDDTVTVGFRRGDRNHAAAIEAEGDKIERFGSILYKARLNGATVAVRHPARVGGRVTDAPLERATLSLCSDGLVCRTDPPLEIDLSGVVHFEKRSSEINGTARPMLAVRHTDGKRMVLSELALSSEDRMNVLGRFLRRRYSDVMSELHDLSLSETETEVLVGIYSGGTGADLAQLSNAEPSRVSMVLNALAEKDLVESDGESLTPRGMMVVSAQIEDVNV